MPNIGVVTNVAPVHLGFFRSVAGIAAAKRELVDALPPDGVAVLNADDEYVSQFGLGFSGRPVTFGIEREADVRAHRLVERGLFGSRFDLVTGPDRVPVELPLAGRHNIYNALAAMAVALQFGIAPGLAAAELACSRPVAQRGEIVAIGGATVCNDCYNSNPRALDSMVDALAVTPLPRSGRRIVVAGEMLELGPAAEELHRDCGRHLAEKKIDVILGVRGLAQLIVDGAHALQTPFASQAEYLETPEMAGEWLARMARPEDLVLVKGSRGVRLERALEIWRERAAANEDL
jgi:UDP-N-acetylmuramoyl-tripeptide--D-alanyl-D-alanine ligase